MPRSDWNDLPAAIRDAIERRTGSITGVRSAPGGNHADLAAALGTAGGTVFVKAARKLADRDGPEVRSLRREAVIAPHMTRFVPGLAWETETEGWLALGFIYVPGRAATFVPGSPDLDVLAHVVHVLQATPCPDVVYLRVEQRWAPFADDVSAMAGDALVHTDLNPDNLIIGDDGNVCVVDWALASRGAAWIEAGQLMPWLILAGHSPRQADAWAAQIPSWRHADPDAVNLYSRLAVTFWRRRAAARPAPWMAPYLAAWEGWTAYRTARQAHARTTLSRLAAANGGTRE